MMWPPAMRQEFVKSASSQRRARVQYSVPSFSLESLRTLTPRPA